MSSELSGRKRRSLKGYLVRPRQQLKLALAMLSILIISLAVLVSVFASNVSRQIIEQQGHNPELANFLQNSIVPELRVLHGGLLLLIVVSVLGAVLLSHKIYGPLVPILRHIHALKARDFTSRIHLRKRDEFADIAQALNELAEALEKDKLV